MKSCGRCGFQNDESMSFCLECGSAISDNGPKMVVPLDAIDADIQPTERVTDSYADQTVIANRFAAPPPPSPPKKSGGMKVFKILLGLTVGVTLLVLAVIGGIAVAVYLSITNSEPRPIVRNPTPTPFVISTPTQTPTPKPTPEITPTPKSVTIDPGTKPTLKADFDIDTGDEWQTSEIQTIGNENFRVVASGNYNLEGVRENVSAKGVAGKRERRIYKQFRTGALLMRTRYPNGKTSNIQAVSTGENWQNYPDEKGNLEFIVNDNSPEDNEGTLRIKFEMIEKPDNDLNSRN